MKNTQTIRQALNKIPPEIVSVGDYEQLAKSFIPHASYEYIAGGSGNEVTLKSNQTAFDSLRLNHSVLTDFSQASTQQKLLGQTLKHPILLAPVAYHKLVHPQGELATAQASNAMETGFIASTLSSVSLEEIAAQTTAPKWFQLYFQPSRETTLSLVKRAEKSGYTALVVTVDAPINGLRYREQRAGFILPENVVAANLNDATQPPQKRLNPGQSIILNGIMADAPKWSDIEWLKQQTSLPIVIKGICNPDDAAHAEAMGLAGVVVSNHGGRALDGLPATISVLPKVRDAVSDDFTVLLDSGIRRGSDVFKAIALGANAVLVGRPQVYALAVAGALGVAHMLRLLQEEFEVTMALTGCPTLAEISVNALVNPYHLN